MGYSKKIQTGGRKGAGVRIYFSEKNLARMFSFVTNLRNSRAEKPSFDPFSFSNPWDFHMMPYLSKIPVPGDSIAGPTSSNPHLLGLFLKFLL